MQDSFAANVSSFNHKYDLITTRQGFMHHIRRLGINEGELNDWRIGCKEIEYDYDYFTRRRPFDDYVGGEEEDPEGEDGSDAD